MKKDKSKIDIENNFLKDIYKTYLVYYKVINSVILILFLILISIIYDRNINQDVLGNYNEYEVTVKDVNNAEKAQNLEYAEKVKNIDTVKEDAIRIFVDGAVNNPDVYAVGEDSRVIDVVDVAGGFSEDAYIDGLNLAGFVNDGDRVYIYSVNEHIPEDVYSEYETNNSIKGVTSEGMININDANNEQLQQLNGIGVVTADSIISYREENGEFQNIDEIMNVSGIGPATFDKIKDKITVD